LLIPCQPDTPTLQVHSLDALQQHFLAILPRIENHAEFSFHHLKCPGRRADAIAETIAISWKWFLRLNEQGKDVNAFVSTLARFAVRHVRCGRKLCGQEKAKEALSRLAQYRHNFRVEPLPLSTRRSHERIHADPHGQEEMDVMEERLKDNTQSPVPEQAAFRIDYPAWLRQLGPRNREVAQDMALEHSTLELARRHRVTPARISQLRRQFHLDWQRFHGQEMV
jgi:hypothetical protein